MKKFTLLLFTLSSPLFIFSQTISTYAGDGNPGHTGDGALATAAEIYNPYYISTDRFNRVYFVDATNGWLRKVNTNTGIISTIAGTGTTGYNGDNIPATSASLGNPLGTAVDTIGNVFISDQSNNRIRMISATLGIITTIAGNGVQGYSGDGGPATAAEINYPSGLSIDDSGNLYISDALNSCIRKYTKSTGIITTLAGNGVSGYSGDGGQATAAELAQPFGNIVDASENVYVADGENNAVRKIDGVTGIITTIAGNTTSGYFGDGGQATAAELDFCYNLALDPLGLNLYIDDANNYVIRELNFSSGTISTYAGDNIQGFSGDGGPATDAELNYPLGLASDPSGNIFIGDVEEQRVREVSGIPTVIPAVENAMESSVYPNPNNGSFTVAFGHPEPVSGSQTKIEIYSMLGEQVYNETLPCTQPAHTGIGGGDNTINMENQPNGVYLYRLLREDGKLVGEGKIVLEK